MRFFEHPKHNSFTFFFPGLIPRLTPRFYLRQYLRQLGTGLNPHTNGRTGLLVLRRCIGHNTRGPNAGDLPDRPVHAPMDSLRIHLAHRDLHDCRGDRGSVRAVNAKKNSEARIQESESRSQNAGAGFARAIRIGDRSLARCCVSWLLNAANARQRVGWLLTKLNGHAHRKADPSRALGMTQVGQFEKDKRPAC
jgi:hypothetical protein